MDDDNEFWEAVEVEPVARELIREYHRHLHEGEAGILYLFTSKERKKKGRIVLGTAQLASSLQRFLTANRPGGSVDFILIFDAVRWKILESHQQAALVDHELAHCIQNEKGDWAIRGHDLEEFTEIVERHGLWRGDLVNMARAIQPYQHELPIDDFDESRVQAAIRKLAEPIGRDGITGITLSGGGASFSIGDTGDAEELYARAKALVKREGRATTTLLHDRLRVTWETAAALIERLKADGIVGMMTE